MTIVLGFLDRSLYYQQIQTHGLRGIRSVAIDNPDLTMTIGIPKGEQRKCQYCGGTVLVDLNPNNKLVELKCLACGRLQ